MSLDITLLEPYFNPFYAEWAEHGISENTGLLYRTKYQYHTFSDITSNLTVRFSVERTFQNGEIESYNFDSVASDETYVDKFGNIVDSDSIDVWGTEMKYMRILFAASGNGLSNANILSDYQQKLFERGTFDFPKNRNLS